MYRSVQFFTFLFTDASHPFEPSEREKGRIMLPQEGEGEVSIGDASVSAKSGAGRQIAGAHEGFLFHSTVTTTRKRDSRIQPQGAKRIEISDGENTLYSFGEPVGGGSVPSVILVSKERNDSILDGTSPAIEVDPDFSLFCSAIEILRSSGMLQVQYVRFGNLPEGKAISLLGPPMNKPRRYAVAKVTTKRRQATWLIIELCLADGYSLSTLLVRVNQEQSSKKLANRLIDNLFEANGHWVERCFPPGIIYRTLDHRKGRSADRLAELILGKLLV